MQIHAARSCEGLAHAASKFINSRSVDIKEACRDMTLHIGPANDPMYQTPASARDCLYVGDGGHIGALLASESVKALYAKNPNAVNISHVYNSSTNKWDIRAKAKPQGVGDALPDLIESQAIAPWSQGFFQDIFERPLLYSHASDLVKPFSGDKPWCEVMNLYLADYGGTAMGPNGAGTGENSMTKDVTTTSGIMSAMVVNMYVTYSFTIEEQEGAKQAGGNPFGQKMMQKKISYANYVLQMLTDYLTYFGNEDTDTQGLFQVNTITAYSGTPIKDLVSSSTNATKGSTLYQQMSQLLNDFFHSSYNKFDHVKIAMSTYAYNQWCSLPYSDNYSGESAATVFDKNYNGGRNTKEGNRDPRVEFYADPLLDANSDFNSNPYDYLVITAPEVGQGPEDERKSVILQGIPLKEFVYPVIPGMVNTQHRMLRRYSGVYAPISESVKIYSGFGQAS